MSPIVPALLVKSRAELEDKLGRLVGHVSAVQLDVVDGHYVGPATWPYTEGGAPSGNLALPALDDFSLELDLMTEDPGKAAGTWIENGITRITIHAESARDLPAVLARLRKEYGHDKGFAPGLLSVGLAIGPATESAMIEPYMDQADYVQFMGILNIGRQGEPFDQRTLQKVRFFHKTYPDMPLQVDGGVTLENAPALLDAGVSRLIIGSGLWKAPNLIEALAAYTALAEEYGLYRK